MNKIIYLLLLVVLLSSCVQNRLKESSGNDLTEIQRLLESDQAIGRSGPLVLRKFDPYRNVKAVSYGCYRQGQAPGVKGPDAAEILEDLKIIEQHWNLIRVYNADDDTQRILEVIREYNLPIKVMLGIWLENEENNPQAKESNITNVMRGIQLASAYPEQIAAVNVGNETQVFWSGHRLKSERLLKYLRVVRAYTSVAVTTADDYNFWNKAESKEIAGEVDFIVTHIYPLWNGKTLDNSISWLDATYAEVQKLHPQMLVVLGEIGWATDYDAEKKGDGQQGTLVKGEVGLEAQERFLLELDAWTQEKMVICFWFEVFDEPWKGGGEQSTFKEIEKNWGLFYANRTPKMSFSNYLTKKRLQQQNP